jgi:hypothetical protein
MIRALYASLLRLHPPSFRRRFGTEMLWIFDQARVSEGALVLLVDLFISALRQWLMRSGLWKAMLALAGATIQVIAFGLGGIASLRHTAANHPGATVTPLMSDLMLLTLSSFGIVFVGVFVTASWVTRFNRRRLAYAGAAHRRLLTRAVQKRFPNRDHEGAAN